MPYENLAAIRDRVELLHADLLDEDALARVLREHGPREVYNLASPSFVPASWREPVRTAEFAAVGVTALLEAIRAVDPSMRVYQASSSEIFGEPTVVPQTVGGIAQGHQIEGASIDGFAVAQHHDARALHRRQQIENHPIDFVGFEIDQDVAAHDQIEGLAPDTGVIQQIRHLKTGTLADFGDHLIGGFVARGLQKTTIGQVNFVDVGIS